ncbi:MAG TPA: ATP-binding protein [Anaerolineales bacterium]|jgi:PAS domain S-box-containing protein
MLPDFRLRQRDYLLETTRALTEELDLDRVLERIVKISAELLAARASLIALRDSASWRISTSHGIRSDFLKRVQRLLADVPGQPDSARFELPEVMSRLQRITETASLGLLSGVGLPLVARDEVIGVIFIFRSYRGAFSHQDRELLQAFASQAAIAVHNARLYTELAQQKRHLDAVVDGAGDGIFILDQSLRFSRFNRACAQLTGYREADVVGRLHDEIVAFKGLQAGQTLAEEILAGWPQDDRNSFYVEGGLKKRGGGTISVGVTYAATLTGQGQLMSVVGNVRDVTRFREAEELKDTFISVVSHELRTPVALIKGYVGTLRRQDATWDPAVVRDSLAVIEEEADHLALLIDDLLDASRLQAGALGLNLGELALDELAERLVERFRIQSHSHQFELAFPQDFPPIQGDEARLHQVLTNLLSNAVKFSPDGGTIIVGGVADKNVVQVCVQDEGPGIPPQEVSYVFDRFYRARETADKSPGTGLGLYLARAVVEAHGGRIWVDDGVGRGAKVCFSLPLAPSDE